MHHLLRSFLRETRRKLSFRDKNNQQCRSLVSPSEMGYQGIPEYDSHRVNKKSDIDRFYSLVRKSPLIFLLGKFTYDATVAAANFYAMQDDLLMTRAWNSYKDEMISTCQDETVKKRFQSEVKPKYDSLKLEKDSQLRFFYFVNHNNEYWRFRFVNYIGTATLSLGFEATGPDTPSKRAKEFFKPNGGVQIDFYTNKGRWVRKSIRTTSGLETIHYSPEDLIEDSCGEPLTPGFAYILA